MSVFDHLETNDANRLRELARLFDEMDTEARVETFVLISRQTLEQTVEQIERVLGPEAKAKFLAETETVL